MEVKGHHPLAELLGKKLFSITTVPKDEQEKMVQTAIKAAVEYYETMKIKENFSEEYFKTLYKEYQEELEGSAYMLVNCSLQTWKKETKKITKRMIEKAVAHIFKNEADNV